MPTCRTCNKECADFKELALHIIASRHRQGKRWAAKYIMMNNLSPSKRFADKRDRIALTDEDKANREDTRRVLSGAQEFVTTLCLRCNYPTRQSLPVEYSQGRDAWRIQGHLVVMCPSCRGGN